VTAGRRSSLERDERWARVAWAYLVEPRSGPVTRLVAEHGAVEALARLREGRCGAAPEASVRLHRLDLDDLVHAAHRQGVHVLVPGDEHWPDALDRHELPPHCLFVRGDPNLAALTRRAVAVVGSRAATDYGVRVAAELGEGLAGGGWTVVSGAAFGIDAAAHRGALAVGGPSIAVLACGVDVAYPRAHEGLLAQVARTGALVSEVPVGSSAYRSRFLARNRIIAMLGRATVVVEAGVRSGALSTAREAGRHHLPVAAVPGPVTSATSAGCHRLVREAGAVLVTDTAEVAELAAPVGEALIVEAHGTAPPAPQDDLDAAAYAVWSAAPVRRALTTEALAVASGVDQRRLPAALAELESRGLVVRDGAGWRKPQRRRTPSGVAAGEPAAPSVRETTR
jgi:DNA processing protein